MTKLKLILFLFLIVGSTIFSQTSDSSYIDALKAPKKYRLAPLKIEGANFTDPSVISLLSGLTEGQEITIPGDKIADAIKALWKQSIFEDIQILQDKIIGKDTLYCKT